MNVLDFQKMKNAQRPITMVTCYDFCMAQILNSSNVDCILVGDSVAMVMHGHQNTIPADVDLIALHTQAVVRGAPDKFIIADMPFFSTVKSHVDTLNNVEVLMRAGAHAVKVEVVNDNIDVICSIIKAGVPVMAHLGLTVQSVHQLGGFRVQNKGEAGLQKLLHHAKLIEAAGCFATVLECIPATAAATVTSQLRIPTIGIGAGVNVDGQVLVLQDLLGMNNALKLKFLKTYLDGFELIQHAVNTFDAEVKGKKFPTEKESYH